MRLNIFTAVQWDENEVLEFEKNTLFMWMLRKQNMFIQYETN